MTTGLPQSLVILSPESRATRSIAPPGDAGTMIVMLFEGKLVAACANAGAPCTRVAAARAAQRIDFFMMSSGSGMSSMRCRGHRDSVFQGSPRERLESGVVVRNALCASVLDGLRGLVAGQAHGT